MLGYLDNYAVTIDLLKKAEVLTQHHHPAERATTLNNLACYYRRLGKLHAAMTSLTRALAIEKKLHNVRNAADTHLNLCAVLSQLGKHQEALNHAQSALLTLQDEFFQKQTNVDDSGGSSPTRSAMQLDRVSVMCIAYHNMGVEQEFLKDLENCVASYKKGVGLAEQYLGVDHAITTTVRNSYLAAKRTIAASPARKSAAMRGSGLSSLGNSAAKSPGRLLQSPRSAGSSGGGLNSLRMPSPLGKNRQQTASGLPTPRSIIADTLSRSSPLPPLRAKSGGALSPEDPFFSPRFRFEEGGVVKKASKKPVAKPKAESESVVLPPEDDVVLPPEPLPPTPEIVVVLPSEIPLVVAKPDVVMTPETLSDELKTASAPIAVTLDVETLQTESYAVDQAGIASDPGASASNAAFAENTLDCEKNQLQCGAAEQNTVHVGSVVNRQGMYPSVWKQLQFDNVEQDVAVVNRQSMYPSVWKQLHFNKQHEKANQDQAGNNDVHPNQHEAVSVQADRDEAASDPDDSMASSTVEVESEPAEVFVSSSRLVPVEEINEAHEESHLEARTSEHSESDAMAGQILDQQDDTQELAGHLNSPEQATDPFVSADSFDGHESNVSVEAVVDLQSPNDLLEAQDEIAPVDVLEVVHSVPSEEEPAEVDAQTEQQEDVADSEFAVGHEVDQQESTPEAIETYEDDQGSASADMMPPNENAPPEYPVAEANAPEELDPSSELHDDEVAAYDKDHALELEAGEAPSEAELTSHNADEMSADDSVPPEDDIIRTDQTHEMIDSHSAQETDESLQYEHEEVADTEQTHDGLGLAHANEDSYYNENDFHEGESAQETLEEQIHRLSSAAHDDEPLATQDDHTVQDSSWEYHEHEAGAELEAEERYEMHYDPSAEDEGVDEGVDHHEYAYEDQATRVDQSQLLQLDIDGPSSLQGPALPAE